MQFKVGEVYKSNATNQLYKYVGKSDDLGFLNFERASGCHIGILDEFSTRYAESVLEIQVETKEEKEMKFKVGETYKSNQSGRVYKYLGKSQGNAYLNFEIVSGGSVGELTQFTIEYAEITLELQVEGVEYHEGDVLRYDGFSRNFWTKGKEYVIYKDEGGLFLYDDELSKNADLAKRYLDGPLKRNVMKYMSFARNVMGNEGEEKAPEVPVFVKATLDEAITAFKEGSKSDFYMYNPKKGICTPLVKETNILMLTTWMILKKVGE